MFRYEKPQKGRYRQFHQFDVEALGFTGPEVREGAASHREKRKPNFPPEPKDF